MNIEKMKKYIFFSENYTYIYINFLKKVLINMIQNCTGDWEVTNYKNKCSAIIYQESGKFFPLFIPDF